MEMVKPETVAAVRNDDFAFSAIEAARELLYLHFRDWETIGLETDPFKDDNAKIAYYALSRVLGTTEPPDIADARVNVRGVPFSVRALNALSKAVRNRAAEPMKQ